MISRPASAAPATAAAWLGVARLAHLLRAGELSAEAVLEECLAEVAARDPGLGAFAHVDVEGARQQARAAQARLEAGGAGPLEGVPLGVKDNREVAGQPTRRGSRATAARPAVADDEIVGRLRRAGAVILGKTTLPEFGAIPVTEGGGMPPARSPWAPERTAGGSSGGSAAAVAAGMVPGAHGNDGAGSLRIPASCCGLVALKPSRGLLPSPTAAGDTVADLVCEGFLTRSAADTAMLLDAVVSPGGPFRYPERGLTAVAALAAPPPRLRIGWTCEPPIEVEVDPCCRRAVRLAAKRLASAGHAVNEVVAPWPRGGSADFRMIWASSMRLAILEVIAQGGDPRVVQPHNRALAELGRGVDAAAYLATRHRLAELVGATLPLWLGHDLLLTPTLAQPPLRIGELLDGTEADPLLAFDRADRFSPFTPLANLSGQPAIQLPLSWEEGLPIGVQLLGPVGSDRLLLQVAQELEESRGASAEGA